MDCPVCHEKLAESGTKTLAIKGLSIEKKREVDEELIFGSMIIYSCRNHVSSEGGKYFLRFKDGSIWKWDKSTGFISWSLLSDNQFVFR